MTREEAAEIVARVEAEKGLPSGLLASIWDQESNQSLDLGLKGANLSRGRGNATGPFQIVPYYHPSADLSSFVSQADYAGQLLKDKGVRAYYGTGTAMPGHPTTDQYEQQVMARIGQNQQVTPQMSGLLGSPQQPQGLLDTPMPMPGAEAYAPSPQQLPPDRPGAYWADFAAGIDTMAPGLGGIAQGLSSANKLEFERELQRTQAGTLSPYQQAQISMQQQQMAANNANQQRAQMATQAANERLVQAREMVAANMDDPVQAELTRLGLRDKDLGKEVADLQAVGGLRKEFKAVPAVKKFSAGKQAYDQLSSVLQDQDNPMNALSAMFLFINSLDPESTVGQGEQALYVGANGALASLFAQTKKALGEGTLTETSARNLIKSAKAALDGSYTQAKAEQDQFTDLSKKHYRVDPTRVVGNPFEQPTLPDWALPKSKGEEGGKSRLDSLKEKLRLKQAQRVSENIDDIAP